MVLELIVKAFVAVIKFLIGLLPAWTLPDWLVSLSADVAAAVGAVLGLGAWINYEAIATAATFLLAAWAIALGIVVARMVLSVFTGGGGSAA